MLSERTVKHSSKEGASPYVSDVVVLDSCDSDGFLELCSSEVSSITVDVSEEPEAVVDDSPAAASVELSVEDSSSAAAVLE